MKKTTIFIFMIFLSLRLISAAMDATIEFGTGVAGFNNSNNYILSEWFFSDNLGFIPAQPTSPLGGGSLIPREIIDADLCNYTYDYLRLYGHYDKSKIPEFLDYLKLNSGKEYDLDIINKYLDDWENICQDYIKKKIRKFPYLMILIVLVIILASYRMGKMYKKVISLVKKRKHKLKEL